MNQPEWPRARRIIPLDCVLVFSLISLGFWPSLLHHYGYPEWHFIVYEDFALALLLLLLPEPKKSAIIKQPGILGPIAVLWMALHLAFLKGTESYFLYVDLLTIGNSLLIIFLLVSPFLKIMRAEKPYARAYALLAIFTIWIAILILVWSKHLQELLPGNG